MRKCFLLFAFLMLVSCRDYKKDLVGWWESEDATEEEFVYYVFRDDGTYKKRMKYESYGVLFDGTDRGTWELDGTRLTLHVLTYNGKEQHGREEQANLVFLEGGKLVFELDDGNRFVYYYMEE